MQSITDTLPNPPKPNHQGEGGGRPTKYKPEYCDELIECMARGYSFEGFASKISVDRDTLYNWRKSYPEFNQAARIGISKSLYFWETMGIQGTAGKLKGFNATSFGLNMANKHKWRAAHDVTSAGEKLELPTLFIPEEKE